MRALSGLVGQRGLIVKKVRYDPLSCRLVIKAGGFLSAADARAILREITAACSSITAGRRLTAYADLSDLSIQDDEVAQINEASSNIIIEAADRYALFVPSALLRMQARRIASGERLRIFDTARAATDWLEWPAGWPDRMLASDRPANSSEF